MFGMNAKFEYRVCFTQESRVTFVNGLWQGRNPAGLVDSKTALDSCPEKWNYLEDVSSDGWMLVAVVPVTVTPDVHSQELYLRRRKR